jgi:hypothetical protein
MADGINRLVLKTLELKKTSFEGTVQFPSEMMLEACLTLRGLCIHGMILDMLLQ